MKPLFNRAIRILLITDSIVSLATAMLGPIYALFVEKVGGDLMDASIAGAIFALVAGIVTLISGKYTDKFKEKELIIALGYGIVGLGFLLYFWVNSVFFLFLVQAIIGLGEAIYSPAFDSVFTQHTTKTKAGVEWGSWEASYYFTTAAGALLGGLLVAVFSFKFLFLVMAALSFGSGLYILHLKRSIL